MKHYTRSIFGACAVASVVAACSTENKGGGPGPAAGGTDGGVGSGSGGNFTGGKTGTSGTASSGGSGGASGNGGTHAGGGTSGVAGANGSGGSHPDSGAAIDAGNKPVACETPNVCDDFESYVPSGGFGPWQENGTSGTVLVDEVHTFSGRQAAHFQVDAGGNKRVQLERTGGPLFPAENNTFWGRVMVWANNLPQMSDTENKNVHYDVIQASGQEPGEYRIAGMGNVLLNYEPHDCYFGTNKVIPEDRWACWEWLYDGTNNVIEFYIDGVLQARMAQKGQGCVDGTDSVWQAPTFNELRIGFVNYQSKPETTDLWMDDFAAGPARVLCPAATSRTH